MDKVNKKAAVINVVVPDSNTRKKEHQKLEGYQGPKEERAESEDNSGHQCTAGGEVTAKPWTNI